MLQALGRILNQARSLWDTKSVSQQYVQQCKLKMCSPVQASHFVTLPMHSTLAVLADWVLSMRGLVCHWLDCSHPVAALILAPVLDPVCYARVLHCK